MNSRKGSTMKTKIFPQLADRDARLAVHTLWRQWPSCGDESRDVWQGQDLAKRLWSIGRIRSGQDLVDVPVGGVIKTGVSAYERIK